MMLQRAASNAYSWWWASHIRTKQSKWLEQNLQDMEDRVNYTLKIIDEDGDTFSQRAEMYYRKRPEIVSFVEEAFRSYRALAERYDHLSKDLQRANRTIASAFPDQLPVPLDEYDYDGGNAEKQMKHTEIETKNGVPKAPEMPKKDFRSPSMVLSRKGTLRRNPISASKAVLKQNSELSRSEALKEIDRLQKGILALQTEKEFVKSTYVEGYEKYCKIENEIDEMQKRVCNLQDEFGTGTVIDDCEARTLMAGTTIRSCKESLTKLEEKQKQSEEVANVANGRVKEALEKFEALKKEFLCEQTSHEKPHAEESSTADASQEPGLESSRENTKRELEEDLTVVQLAEEIDGLVEKVVSLEAAASSQTALVNSLRSETDELHVHIRRLEEEKETLVSGSGNRKKRIGVLEKELCRIKGLCQRFEEQNKNLRTNFMVASCSADHLSGKLRSVKMDEAVQATDSEEKVDETTEDGGTIIESRREVEIKEQRNKDVMRDEERIKIVVETEKNLEPVQEEKTKKDSSEAASGHVDIEPEESDTEEDEDQPKWEQVKPKQVAGTPCPIPAVQKRIREHMDELLEENLEFWLRFSTSVHQIQKFQTTVQDLKLELWKANGKRSQEGNTERQSHSSDVRPIYRHLREIRTELQLWLDNNDILDEEVQARHSSLCNIQDEISQLTHAGQKGGVAELSHYQAAKFHGEVLNMKQENTRVSNELQKSLDRVWMLKVAVERILATLEEDLGISAANNSGSQTQQTRSPTGRPRIPLRSFLFGVKLRRQKQQKSSMFSCVNPSVQKQCSYMAPIERP